MNKLRIGIIGAGGIARGVHLPSLARIPQAKLVAVCDLDEQRATALAKEYAIEKTYVQYAKMISECKLDAVFVLVQPDQAFRIAQDCLRRGLHVFVEKPSGITLFQAKALERAAHEAGRACQVGFNRRFVPLVELVLEKLKSTGPIHQVDGCFFKHGNAAFYDGCASAFECDTIHAIDLVRMIAGGTPRSAAMVAARYGDSPVDNAWNGVIAFDNGVTGTIRANYETGGRVHEFAIHAAKASAYVNLGFGAEACEARILYHQVGTFSLSSSGAGKQKIELIDGMALSDAGEYYDYYGYLAEDRSFVECVMAGQPVLSGIGEGVRTMELVEMMARSTI